MPGDEMSDEASHEMARAIVAKDRAAGLSPPTRHARINSPVMT